MFEQYLNQDQVVPIYDITNLAYPAKTYRLLLQFGGLQLFVTPIVYLAGW